MSIINFQTEVKIATVVLKPHAMRLTRNMHDAEDLIQETIIRALTNEDKFQEGTNIKAWLFTIMRNIFINDYRKKSKRNTVIDTTDNLYYLNASTTISNVGERAFVMNDISSVIAASNSVMGRDARRATSGPGAIQTTADEGCPR